MSQASVTAEQKRKIENYLKEYSLNRKLLMIGKYEEEYFGGGNFSDFDKDMPSEAPLARAKMFDVRHFILSLDNSDEKIFLYFHYVKGEPVEKCAELLGISSRTAFRLKNRALSLAYAKKFQSNIGG